MNKNTGPNRTAIDRAKAKFFLYHLSKEILGQPVVAPWPYMKDPVVKTLCGET